jgi:hypothetical protein
MTTPTDAELYAAAQAAEASPNGAEPPADDELTITVAGAPAGAWMATLTGIEAWESTDEESGEVRPVFTFHWIADVDGRAVVVDQITSRRTGPRSHLYGVLVALVGPAAVVPAATFRASELIGREAILTVEIAEGRSRVAAVTAVPRSTKGGRG